MTWRRWLKRLSLASLLLILLSVVLAVGALLAVWWAVRNPEGSSWLINRATSVVPGLKVVEPQGSLWGDFKARRVELQLGHGSTLTLMNPQWRGLRAYRVAWAPWRVQWHIDALSADSADLLWKSSPKPSTTPMQGPTQLNLPVGLKVNALQIGRFQSNVTGASPFLDIRGALEIQQPGEAPGQNEHRVVVRSLRWQQWLLSGQARVGAEGELPVDARVSAVGSTVQGDRADLSVQGPMKLLKVMAEVKVAGRSGQEGVQSLALDGELAPFSPWPVPRARLQAEGFDLQRMADGLPGTSLTGTAIVVPRDVLPGAPGTRLQGPGTAAAAPSDVLATIDLRNDEAGLWDAGRVPVMSVNAQVTLPGQADASRLASLGRQGLIDARVLLPSSGGRAPGTVVVQGRWNLDQLQSSDVRATLARVEPQALHSSAPPLLLQGTVGAAGQADQTWRIQGSLDGRDGGSRAMARPAQATFTALWSKERVLLESLKLVSGGSQALAKGQWTVRPAGGWDALGDIRVQAFDPAAWVPWPRPAGDAIQRTRIDGTVSGAITALTADPATWRGKGQLDFSDSVLLGVPFKAASQWQLADGQGAGKAGQIVADLALQAAANEVRADMRWPLALRPQDSDQPAPAVAGGQINANLKVPSLGSFQPWASVLGWQGLTGAVSGELTLRQPKVGQWITTGQLQADGVRADLGDGGQLVLGETAARWSLDTGGASAPWVVDARVGQAQWGRWAVRQGVVDLQGTRQNHALSVQARVDLPERRLPSGLQVRESAQAQLRMQAGWRGELTAAQAGKSERAWQGQVQTLKVQPLQADGSVSPAGAWLEAQPFGVKWSQQGAAQRWSATSTRLSLFGAQLDLARLQWQQQGTQSGQTDVQVQLQPLKVADLLARVQPRAGWGGDLTVAGRVSAVHRSGQPWVVDAQLARQAGDLTLTEMEIDGSTLQRLGVRQLQLDLKARDGVWRATQLVDVRVVGVLKGEQVVQVRDASALPGPADALSGRITAEVANLRSLSVWAPAGWRVTGQLSAEAELGGTLGQPQYGGRLMGKQLAIGNVLQGVQLTDGELLLTLKGDRATLERFKVKGGEGGGTLSMSGDVVLGAQPVANLAMQAERFALLQRVDRRARVSGEALVGVSAEAINVDGRFKVDDGLIDISRSDAPTIGDDVNVVNRPGQADIDARAAAAGPPRKLNVTVLADLGSNLRLKGRGIDTELAGSVRVTTPNGRLQVHGAIQTVDGTYAAYGQKLVIDRGSLAFTGPVDNPRLDIQAMRAQSPTAAASDVKVGVLITGTAQDPRVRLYSEPPMSETEKLSWLVLGRGPAGLGGADIGLLRTAAAALLAGDDGSPTDGVLGAIGLDELSVRQTDGAVRDTIISLGKQISDKVYLGYERSLNATTGSWQLIYRVAARFTLRAQTGEDDAIDLIWSWRWD